MRTSIPYNWWWFRTYITSERASPLLCNILSPGDIGSQSSKAHCTVVSGKMLQSDWEKGRIREFQEQLLTATLHFLCNAVLLQKQCVWDTMMMDKIFVGPGMLVLIEALLESKGNQFPRLMSIAERTKCCLLLLSSVQFSCSVVYNSLRPHESQHARPPCSSPIYIIYMYISVVPCPLLTVASWPAYRFLKRQVRWSGIPISCRIFHSLWWSNKQSQKLWHSQ